MTSFLYPYRYLPDHLDPLFDEFTYGDAKARGKRLKEKLNRGDYIFFWTNIAGMQYITAYYVVDKVLEVDEAKKDHKIMEKYRNPHLKRSFYEGEDVSYENDVVVFGDVKKSRKLGIPLSFNRTLAERFVFNPPKTIDFQNNRTDAENIGSACRQPRELTKEDVKFLVTEIENLNTEGKFPLDISDWREKEIESVLAKNPDLIDPDFKLVSRQLHGHIDLVFEDSNGNLIVVEVKEGLAPEGTLTQILDYRRVIKEKYDDKKVDAIIVCAGVSSRLKRAAEENKVKIHVYGGKFYTEML